ncbi:serine hydrolase domain-containing protein [Tuwongella immobilis]|uniref:Beta-lactamase-related domain-containing protein n=1 Tax=Tuwongella immobilis TaxID=692036 RepID=A0A6C2YTK5_9BACT|nr:serine hydrolase domain-containing protein [Tuwongella immobilis]VIP04245.1 Putative beta-lactamase OS=Planctomyces maris DSM 8797 GN=PM8797T_16228 PE=4 SV=1: Beta-lactamase [Tuwongella immobilis]VTS05853.1 Putative beta-lactamase OS=Planctomyces maris DSM 8797 GN=PM8797T_16228 PE=4 SV=1: Beta-lactamase [Tuwongella immobilis]
MIATPHRREWLLASTGLLAASGIREMTRMGAVGQAAEPRGAAGMLRESTPAAMRLDPLAIQRVYDRLDQWTRGPNPAVPSAAILIGRGDRFLPTRRFGRMGPEANAEPIRDDALFYLASITKPIIYTTAMQLVERGELVLSDRVTRYLPEFLGDGKSETQVLHLFTHTSGLADELPNNIELRKAHEPLSTFVREALRSKLLFPSGTDQSYSSLATILTAEMVQRLSQKTIREMVRIGVTEPLGMRNTALGSQGLDRSRIVRSVLPENQKGGDFDWNSRYWQEFGSPTGGIFSTPDDLAILCVTMLQQGQFGEQRILSPASVAMMTTNRLDDLPKLPEPIRRTQPWGLGWRLNHLGRADSWGDLLGRHVFGHTGSTGNVLWIDPKTQVYCIILSNYLRATAPWRLVQLSNQVAAAVRD